MDMKSISFSVKNLQQENLLLQFAKQHHIELEKENEFGFIVSNELENEFKEKTGYTLSEYQQSIVADEKAEYLAVTDFKNNQAQ
ncbi:MAG: hypothetical protein RI955_1637 [Bacteroidota bacterium]